VHKQPPMKNHMGILTNPLELPNGKGHSSVLGGMEVPHVFSTTQAEQEEPA